MPTNTSYISNKNWRQLTRFSKDVTVINFDKQTMNCHLNVEDYHAGFAD